MFIKYFENMEIMHSNRSASYLLTYLGHSNVFFCFASDENPKTYQPAREKNKQEILNKTKTDLVNLLK